MANVLVFAAFHYDVAYRDTFEGYLPRSFAAIDAGLDLLDAHAGYVFCIEQVILLDAYWQRRPENRTRLRRHAQARRLIFCPGAWTMPDGNLPSAESCYRNVLLGREWLLEHLGVEPGPICWMADIFGHHPQSPQIYRQLGYTLYMFERGQLETKMTTDFWWQGIDGTKLLTHWENDTYYGLNLGLAWLGNRPDDWIAKRIHAEVLDRLRAYGGEERLTKIGGDFLCPSQTHLDYVKRWNAGKWGPRLEFAHPERFIARVSARPGLPTLPADFNPLLQGTYSTRIRLKQLNRRLERAAFALESLSVATGRTIATRPYWRGIAKLQFHDIICGSLGETAWQAAICETEQLECDVRTRTLDLLTGHGGDRTILFNPSPYPRTAAVATSQGERLVTVGAMTAAPLADVVTTASPVKVDLTARTLDNGLLHVRLDALGRVSTLQNLRTGAICADARYGYVHDVALEPDFGDPWTLHTGPVNSSILHITPYADPPLPSGVNIIRHGIRGGMRAGDSQCRGAPEVTVEQPKSGCRATLRVRYGAGLTVHYTLVAGEPLLRVHVQHRLGAIQHRLRAVMPTGIRGGRIRREVPAGWIEQRPGEYPTQTWVDYADANRGLCVLNRGLPGNNVTDGVILLTLFRAVALIEPNVLPDFELNVEQSADYALLPFTPGDRTYDPARLGACFNQPLLAAENAAPLASRGVRFELAGGRAELMAVRWVDAGRVELRLHESAGQAGPVRLRSSQPLRAARRVTPFGAFLAAVPLRGKAARSLNLPLKPFEIVTLQVTLRPRV